MTVYRPNKDCKLFAECGWVKELGVCPNNCVHFRHIDEVRVIRCKDCRFIIDRQDGTHGCYIHFMDECKLDDYCSYGEKSTT